MEAHVGSIQEWVSKCYQVTKDIRRSQSTRLKETVHELKHQCLRDGRRPRVMEEGLEWLPARLKAIMSPAILQVDSLDSLDPKTTDWDTNPKGPGTQAVSTTVRPGCGVFRVNVRPVE